MAAQGNLSLHAVGGFTNLLHCCVERLRISRPDHVLCSQVVLTLCGVKCGVFRPPALPVCTVQTRELAPIAPTEAGGEVRLNSVFLWEDCPTASIEGNTSRSCTIWGVTPGEAASCWTSGRFYLGSSLAGKPRRGRNISFFERGSGTVLLLKREARIEAHGRNVRHDTASCRLLRVQSQLRVGLPAFHFAA